MGLAYLLFALMHLLSRIHDQLAELVIYFFWVFKSAKIHLASLGAMKIYSLSKKFYIT